MTRPAPDIVARVESLLGWTPETWRPVHGGYTPAARYVAKKDRRSAFLEVATTPLTARLLLREIDNYSKISAPFMPRLLGFDTDPDQPFLIIEDLSAATWPPPWTDRHVSDVIDAIRAVHATRADIRRGTVLQDREAGRPTVAADPAPFLSLNLVSSRWLERALPQLLAAEAACVQAGDALTHLDLRSDNICITADGVKFIDWAEAMRSSADVDLGAFLPSLAYEGGPLPETILPHSPEIAALISGFFAARAGLPVIPDAPFVRRVQREQLSTALPWAIRAVGLPPADQFPGS